jgi:serine/threonine protein kinase
MEKKPKLPKLEHQLIEGDLFKVGRHSATYLARHKYTGVVVEVMHFRYEPHTESPVTAAMLAEVSHRKLLGNISTLQTTLTVFQRPGHTSIVSEHLTGESPVEVAKNGALPIAQVKYLFFLLAQTVANIQSLGLSVRDWSPSRFLMAGAMIRIVDYSQFRPLQSATAENLLSMCPDVRWIAPEMAQYETFDAVACDSWGLGLYLYLFLYGKPYIAVSKEADIWQQLVEKPAAIARGVEAQAENLLRQLLSPKPADRPHVRDVLGHKFLQPTIPFPIVRIPFDLDPRIVTWLNFFGVSVEDSVEMAGHGTLLDGALYYHLAASAVSLGVAPPSPQELIPKNDQEVDPKYVAFPDLSFLCPDQPIGATVKKRSVASKSKSAQSEKRSKVADLLAIGRRRFADAGVKVLQLALFGEDILLSGDP